MLSPYARRVLVATGIVLSLLVLVYFLQVVAHALLLVFAGVLLAVFLSSMALFLHRYARLPQGVALTVGILLVVGFLAGTGWLVGPRVAEQASQLTERLPTSVEKIRSSLSQYRWGEMLLSHMPQGQGSYLSSTNILGRITGIFSTTLGILTNILVVIIVGLFLALNPTPYIEGVTHLFPKGKRARIREVFQAEGHGLRWWLIGRLCSMLVVGLLTGLGLWLVGLPLVFTLGLLAGLLSFVPYVGPIVSAVPGLLVALSAPGVPIWVVALVYLGVQLLESNAITPLIQERAVSLPPALLVVVQLLGGLLAGLLGVLVATPLTVALIILVQMLYVEDVLGDTVLVMGE